jgi:DNA invertase Pin-like site-specific DNA recombinase
VTAPERAVGYVRVRIGGGVRLVDDRMVKLQTQRIARECERRGWVLDELFVDRRETDQPDWSGALDIVRQGGHRALVVATFDRFRRSDPEVIALSRLAAAEGWTLVVAP